jgi:hypothetical protein
VETLENRVELGNNELISMAGAFVESIMMVHNIPLDFDGLSMVIQRDPDTHKLLAVILSPVDQLDDGPRARYTPDTGRRSAVEPAKVLIPV